MATDNFGRPIEGVSPDDLASQMAQPVKQAGAGDVVAQLNALAASQAALGKKIEQATKAAVGANEAIAKKLSKLEDAIESNLAAAKALNQQIKNAAKGRGGKDSGLTESGLTSIMRKYSQPSSELKQIHATITSKNTVYVKEKELRSLTRHLIKAVESLASAVDSGGSASGGSGGGGRRRAPLGSLGTPLESGGSPGGDLGGMASAGKRAKKDWRAIRSETSILLNLASKFFDVEKSRYRLNGENIEQHSFFQNQMNRYLFDENQNLKISGDELKNIVELEGKRVGLASFFTKQQNAEMVRLRREIAGAGDDDAKRVKAIKEYHKYMEMVTFAAEEQQNKLASNWEMIKEFGREAANASESLHRMGYGFTVSEASTKGLLENHRKWVQESGQVAFYQGTITSEIQKQDALVTGMTSSFRNNFVFSEAMARTGKSMAKMQEQQLKNQKKGIKDAQLANRLAEKGLYFSTALGSNAEQTAEFVRSWHMEMGLSEKSIGRLVTGVKGVAGAMGLVGDEMTKVMESTRRVVENMRNLGTLTAGAATEMIKLNAAGQKFGVGGKTQEISELLTGGLTKIGDNPRLLAGMTQALNQGAMKEGLSGGQTSQLMREMMMGELPKNREGMRVLSEGMEVMADQIARQTGASNAQNMTMDQRAQANVIAQGLGFDGIGQLTQLAKASREANMTYTERLSKLQEERKKINEKELSALEKSQLRMRESSLTFAESAKLLGELSEGKTLNKNDLQGFGLQGAGSAQQRQVLLKQMFDASQKSRQSAIDAGASKVNLGEGLTSADLKRAQAGDIEGFLAKAEQADQRLTVEMNRLADPITKQTMLLQNINDFLQTRFGGFIGWLTHNPIFQTGATLFGGISKYFELQNSLRGYFPKLAAASEAGKNFLKALWERGSRPGSIYTHDTHVTKQLRKIESAIYSSGGVGGGAGGMVDLPGSGRRRGRGRSRLGRRAAAQARLAERGGRGFMRGGRGRGRGRGLGSLLAGSAMLADGSGMLSPETAGLMDTGMLGWEAFDTVQGIGSMFRGGGGTANVAKATGAAGNLTKGAGGLGRLAGAGRVLGSVGGKALPFLSLLTGGVTGALEAESVGRGTVEGTILGALTGDADTGSMFSGMLGIEKGSMEDELLGVAGAGAGGALTGAAIGSVVPVVGTALGAAIGGAIGTGAELYKVMTKPNSPLRKKMTEIGGGLMTGIKNTGMFLLQGGLVGWGARKMFNTIADPNSPVRKKLTEWSGALVSGAQTLAGVIVNPFQKGDLGTKLLEGLKITGMAGMFGPMGMLAAPLLNSMSGSMEQKIKQDQIGKDPDKKSSGVAGDIGGVKENTGETVEQLKILVDQMKTFLTLMNSGGSSGGGGRSTTAANTRPNVMFDYHTWQLGNSQSDAAKGPVTPDGLV